MMNYLILLIMKCSITDEDGLVENIQISVCGTLKNALITQTRLFENSRM